MSGREAWEKWQSPLRLFVEAQAAADRLVEARDEGGAFDPDDVTTVVAVVYSMSEKGWLASLSGHRGGSKGGLARAASLSSERRSEIAKKAAEARWGKKP